GLDSIPLGILLEGRGPILPSSLEQSVLIGSIPCAEGSLARCSVSARKAGTVILRAEMLDWINATGDRIRTGVRLERCELRRAIPNNDSVTGLQDRPYYLQSWRRNSPRRDLAAIRRVPGGK